MQYPRRFVILTLVLLGSIVGIGAVHGLWTSRWPSTTADQEIAEMEKLPIKFGVWEGKTIRDEQTRAALPDESNCLVRRYVNQVDGTVASILLTRGRPGPMVIKHLPTECYPSSGYELTEGPKRYISRNADNKEGDEFWVATFRKNTDVYPLTVRVYWSWSADGRWQIPDRPRMTFASAPLLYKLYVTQSLHHLSRDDFEGSSVHDLIKELAHSMRGSIFASSKN